MAPPVAEESTSVMTPHMNDGQSENIAARGKILGKNETISKRTYIR
jgi:hypothetical protein